jgi:hypothetical protein
MVASLGDLLAASERHGDEQSRAPGQFGYVDMEKGVGVVPEVVATAVAAL